MAKIIGHEWTDEEVVQFMKDSRKRSEEAKATRARADARRALKKPPSREEVEAARNCMLNVTAQELCDEELVQMLMDIHGVSRDVASECVEKYQPSKEGHVAPLDIVAQKDKYPALFEEFVGFSDRWKESIKGNSGSEKLYPIDANGYCTRIL